jgi:hypothetical protein
MDERMLEQVERAVLGSARYRHVSPALVREIGRAELGKGRGLKETVKAVNNKWPGHTSRAGATTGAALTSAGWLS